MRSLTNTKTRKIDISRSQTRALLLMLLLLLLVAASLAAGSRLVAASVVVVARCPRALECLGVLRPDPSMITFPVGLCGAQVRLFRCSRYSDTTLLSRSISTRGMIVAIFFAFNLHLSLLIYLFVLLLLFISILFSNWFAISLISAVKG